LRTPEERMRDQLLKRLNSLVSAAGYADSQLSDVQTRMDAEIKVITDKYGPKVDELTKRRERAVDSVQKIIEAQWDVIQPDAKSKTIKLRAGDISRRSTSKIEILDAKKALAWLRRRAILRRFTTQAEPAISKTKLAKEPAVLAKIPGVQQVTSENMTVKPVKAQTEMVRDLHPLRRSIGTD
jgi:phage host-nuclease inhibitor protein Gam